MTNCKEEMVERGDDILPKSCPTCGLGPCRGATSKDRRIAYLEDKLSEVEIKLDTSTRNRERSEALLKLEVSRLDVLEQYLSDHTKNLGQPSEGSPGWEFGYNGGFAYVIDAYGDTLRACIDDYIKNNTNS